MEDNVQLWVDKYRPKTLNDVVLDTEVRNVLKSYISKKTIPNLLFSGSAGKGKTTLARVLVNELDATYLYINASVENGVDVMRNKIRDFCNSVAINGGIKIVILDEMDGMSSSVGSGASAQDALRQIIEESSTDTRFILTCNFLNKVIEPIKSRCVPMNVRHSHNDVIARCIQIIKSEGIKTDKETMTCFIDNVIKSFYPDIRSIINNLERWCISGIMTPMNISEAGDMQKIVSEIMTLIKSRNAKAVRELCISNETMFSGDYEKLTGELFNAFDSKPIEQVAIADGLYKMGVVLDKEIQFYALILKLCEKD